jgi:hypothetical protein
LLVNSVVVMRARIHIVPTLMMGVHLSSVVAAMRRGVMSTSIVLTALVVAEVRGRMATPSLLRECWSRRQENDKLQHERQKFSYVLIHLPVQVRYSTPCYPDVADGARPGVTET